jgi:hypothetical protein
MQRMAIDGLKSLVDRIEQFAKNQNLQHWSADYGLFLPRRYLNISDATDIAQKCGRVGGVPIPPNDRTAAQIATRDYLNKLTHPFSYTDYGMYIYFRPSRQDQLSPDDYQSLTREEVSARAPLYDGSNQDIRIMHAGGVISYFIKSKAFSPADLKIKKKRILANLDNPCNYSLVDLYVYCKVLHYFITKVILGIFRIILDSPIIPMESKNKIVQARYAILDILNYIISIFEKTKDGKFFLTALSKADSDDKPLNAAMNTLADELMQYGHVLFWTDSTTSKEEAINNIKTNTIYGSLSVHVDKMQKMAGSIYDDHCAGACGNVLFFISNWSEKNDFLTKIKEQTGVSDEACMSKIICDDEYASRDDLEKLYTLGLVTSIFDLFYHTYDYIISTCRRESNYFKYREPIRRKTRFIDSKSWNFNRGYLTEIIKAAHSTNTYPLDTFVKGLNDILDSLSYIEAGTNKVDNAGIFDDFVASIGGAYDTAGMNDKKDQKALKARLRKLEADVSGLASVKILYNTPVEKSSPGETVAHVLRRLEQESSPAIDTVLDMIDAAVEDCYKIVDSATDEEE